MDGFEIATMVAAYSAVGGLIWQWRKNGKDQAKRDQKRAEEQAIRDNEISNNQKHIIERLDHPETGLSALNGKIHTFETNCAGITAAYGERIKSLEREAEG